MWLKAALTYFALVFGAGFVLGFIRVLFLVPRVGVRVAELLEAPLMLLVSLVSAKWVVRHFQIVSFVDRLIVGAVALLLMAVVEFLVVLRLRGMTIAEYFAQRDAVSGTVYFALLAAFALMPVIVKRT